MAQPSHETRQGKGNGWKLILFCLLYITVALACLLQWGTPARWSRVNLFSGGFLVITGLWVLHLNYFNHTALRSVEARQEFAGLDYDPAAKKKTARLTILLPLIDMLIILDYGHWHLVPALDWQALQGFGLGLYIIAFAWLLWVDTCLTQYFTTNQPDRKFLSHGPYRYVRHPRYATILAYRIAYALVFASIIGWVMVLVWGLNIIRRVRVEEAHMQEVFGNDYRHYIQQTARLLPGIY
jgi:protein-S-isoprenylcysteine O-methyltransferase Ste14